MGEYLHNYIDRFKGAASKVRDLRPTIAADSFIRNMSYEECKEYAKNCATESLRTYTKPTTSRPPISLRTKGSEPIIPVLEEKLLGPDRKP